MAVSKKESRSPEQVGKSQYWRTQLNNQVKGMSKLEIKQAPSEVKSQTKVVKKKPKPSEG